jgi:hypothetical protein
MQLKLCGCKDKDARASPGLAMEAYAAYCEPSDASNIVEPANRKRLSGSDLANQSIGQKEGVT